MPFTVGTQKAELKPDTLVRYTVCDPVTLELQLGATKAANHSAKARYEARDGQVYRLTRAKSGEISVEIGAR